VHLVGFIIRMNKLT